PVLTGEDKLRFVKFGARLRCAKNLQLVLGVFLEPVDVGAQRQKLRHVNLLSSSARRARFTGRKKAFNGSDRGGFNPSRAPSAAPSGRVQFTRRSGCPPAAGGVAASDWFHRSGSAGSTSAPRIPPPLTATSSSNSSRVMC